MYLCVDRCQEPVLLKAGNIALNLTKYDRMTIIFCMLKFYTDNPKGKNWSIRCGMIFDLLIDIFIPVVPHHQLLRPRGHTPLVSGSVSQWRRWCHLTQTGIEVRQVLMTARGRTDFICYEKTLSVGWHWCICYRRMQIYRG